MHVKAARDDCQHPGDRRPWCPACTCLPSVHSHTLFGLLQAPRPRTLQSRQRAAKASTAAWQAVTRGSR